MSIYSVFYYCNECQEVHPLGMSLTLHNGPKHKVRARDIFIGNRADPNLVRMKGNTTTCPNTGKLTSQEDDKHLFLIPLGDGI